jgi:hypothetical protein
MPADGIARSSFYEEPIVPHDHVIVEAIAAVCDEFEAYGCRRVRAGLRHRGLIVNHKKVRRLMREHDLRPRRRRRYVVAEGAGFEPAIRFPVYTLSRRAPSTARPPLRLALRLRRAKARRIAPGARPAQAEAHGSFAGE